MVIVSTGLPLAITFPILRHGAPAVGQWKVATPPCSGICSRPRLHAEVPSHAHPEVVAVVRPCRVDQVIKLGAVPAAADPPPHA